MKKKKGKWMQKKKLKTNENEAAPVAGAAIEAATIAAVAIAAVAVVVTKITI